MINATDNNTTMINTTNNTTINGTNNTINPTESISENLTVLSF